MVKERELSSGHVLGLVIWLKGWTLREAAKKADVSVSHLTNIVKGRTPLQDYQAQRLSQALGLIGPRLLDPQPYEHRIARLWGPKGSKTQE